MTKKRSIFENAAVKRAVQYVQSGAKNEENLVYSIEVELNSKPIIFTVRVGKDFMDATVADKASGEILEYAIQQGSKVEAMKKHNLNFEDVRKMLEMSEKTA